VRKALAEGIFVALQMNKPIPMGAQDAFVIIETESRPTLDELDSMPQRLVDTLLLYRQVKGTIEHGGVMTL
jgi:hypothetical protein